MVLYSSLPLIAVIDEIIFFFVFEVIFRPSYRPPSFPFRVAMEIFESLQIVGSLKNPQ